MGGGLKPCRQRLEVGSSVGLSEADSPFPAAPSTRRWWWSPRSPTARHYRARRMRPLCALRRERRGRGAAPSRLALEPSPDGLTRAELAVLLPRRRRPQRARLRAVGPRGEAVGQARRRACGTCRRSIPCTTAFTLSLGSPEAMAARAREAAHYPLLKLKLGGDGDNERMRAVREAVPQARLIVDANEAWQPHDVGIASCRRRGGRRRARRAATARRKRRVLAQIERPVPVCADESVHDRASLEALASRYDAVNIKLDKTGGLTEALLVAAARSRTRTEDHGGQHGRDLAGDRPCPARRARRRLGRSRRAAAARSRPRARA